MILLGSLDINENLKYAASQLIRMSPSRDSVTWNVILLAVIGSFVFVWALLDV